MTLQVTSPPEPAQKRVSQPLLHQEVHVSRVGIVSLLVLIGLLLLLFSGLLIHNLVQGKGIRRTVGHGTHVNHSATQVLDPDQDNDFPLSVPGNANPPPLYVPLEHYVVYELRNALYRLPATGGQPELIDAPGYVYSQAVPPIVTPSGQLLYSGDGLWLTDIFSGGSRPIASLPPGQVITSMVLSSDGTTIAWSTEPADGIGSINLYAGPLESSTLVYQHSTADCPCLRVFSFMNSAGGARAQKNTTLLLTDDRGDHRAIQYGLWTFNFGSVSPDEPQLLLDQAPQGPLVLAPDGNTLLYSSYEGIVPIPTDGSVSDEVAEQNYPNSLYITTIGTKPFSLSASQVVLPEQHDLSNSAMYHWVTSPLFSADGHRVVYIEFSSDAQAPYDRHSALYTVSVSGSGSHLRAGKPQLVAVSASLLIELGAWLNNHILTFYADGALYALDIQTGATATIAKTGAYTHIVAVMGDGLMGTG